MINGSSADISGFAKLLTNLNLEYDWPEGTLDIGNTAVLKVRLTGDPVVLNDPQLKNLIFYSYKIINLKSGNVYLQGKLSDSGENGDAAAGDGIFGTSITLNEEGDFKMFVSAIGPTFFTSSSYSCKRFKGAYLIENICHQTDLLILLIGMSLRLHGGALQLKNRRLSVIAEIVNTPGSEYSIKLEFWRGGGFCF